MSVILDEAKNVVYDRQVSYGTPEDNFTQIAELWSAYLGTPIRPEDVGAMMILLNLPGKGISTSGIILSMSPATLSV